MMQKRQREAEKRRTRSPRLANLSRYTLATLSTLFFSSFEPKTYVRCLG